MNQELQRPADQKGSLTFAARQTFVRPMQRVITAMINDYHQAVADKDTSAQARLRKAILAKLDEFDATGGDGHQYPDWIRPVMRANAHGAFGELEKAVEYELEGARHAQIDMHKAISANNLSDHYRRLGRMQDAVREAERAFELWPENDGIIVNLALALYKAGRREDAGRIIDRLSRISDLNDPRNILAAHLRFEQEMNEMRDLPEVRALLERVENARRAGNDA